MMVWLFLALTALSADPETTPSVAGAWTCSGLSEAAWEDGKNVDLVELGRTATVSLQCVRVRGTVAPHIHERHTETIVILSGTGRFRLGDREIPAGPGDVFLVPPNTIHGFTVEGDAPAVAATTFSPPFDGKDRVPVPPREN